jgi:hypothetical protein
MNDSDGTLIETVLKEPITEIIQRSECGEAEKTKIPRSQKLTGELKCRAFNLLTGYDMPRAYIASDRGMFYVEMGDAQIASFIKDGGDYLAKKLRDAEK